MRLDPFFEVVSFILIIVNLSVIIYLLTHANNVQGGPTESITQDFLREVLRQPSILKPVFPRFPNGTLESLE